MADIPHNNEPHIVRVNDFRIDADYAAWVSEIKRRYVSAQIKINTEKLRFNWSIGRDLVTLKAEKRWGSGVVEQLSLDLQEAFPKAKGFGTTNLWAMKKWYLFFSSTEAAVLSALDSAGCSVAASLSALTVGFFCSCFFWF